jgi:hypothetical protein
MCVCMLARHAQGVPSYCQEAAQLRSATTCYVRLAKGLQNLGFMTHLREE